MDVKEKEEKEKIINIIKIGSRNQIAVALRNHWRAYFDKIRH